MTLDSSVKAKKVMLSFSADGSEDFGEREMKEASPGNWMAEIPASATQGGKVSYYIEVDGDDDQVVASKGSAASPLVVSLRGPGGAPLGPGKKAAAPLPKKEESEGPTWYIGLGIGSGFGWTTGTGEVYSQDVVKPAGFAAAKLGQITPEVGYFLSPDLILSLQLRFQKVSGATSFYATDTTTCGTSTICAPPSLAISAFARAHFLFHFDELHPFVSAAVGGGAIRHVTSFPSNPKCGSDMKTTCVDTLDAGPIFLGGGGGLLYNLSDNFALMAESNLLLGFTNFTFNVDINVGVAVEFYNNTGTLGGFLRPPAKSSGGQSPPSLTRSARLSSAGPGDLGREEVGVGVDGDLGVDADAGGEDGAVGDPEVLQLVVAAARVDDGPGGVGAHRRAAHLVRREHRVTVGAKRRRGYGGQV